MPESSPLVCLLHGPDQPGLVAKVSGWIFDRGGNIVHADQHRDLEAAIFFQRVEWTPAAADTAAAAAAAFEAFAAQLGMAATIASADHRSRMVLFVSRADHCFHDIVLRWKAGEFAGDIVAVVSNHEILREAAEGYGLPFHHTPTSAATRARSEATQWDLLKECQADVVILARYMQVLSADFLRRFGRPVINIHHSFLPAFAGGRPYHQAHARGVKLIGATAHYATAALDDGPIIQQDVTRVTHRHGVADLVRHGRDLERLVLARAVRWHLEHRVLVYGNKTVVFD